MLYKIYKFFDCCRRGFNKIFLQPGMKQGMISCGEKTKIGANCELKPLKNIQLGNRVEIGPRALFWTTRAKIIIGDAILYYSGTSCQWSVGHCTCIPERTEFFLCI